MISKKLNMSPLHNRNLAAELKLANRRDEEIDHLRAAVNDLPPMAKASGAKFFSSASHSTGTETVALSFARLDHGATVVEPRPLRR